MFISRALRLSMMTVWIVSVFPDARAQSEIRVGRNVQVSKLNESFKHDEVVGCADPQNPAHLMVGSIVNYMDRFSPWTATYLSFDGGKSWTRGVENRPSDGVSQDPTCAYAADGTAYFASTRGNRGVLGDETIFFHSPDGGRTWLPPSTIFGAFDRPFIAVDNTRGKYKGRIYVSHNGPGAIALQRSLDEGQTFLGPTLRPNLKEIPAPGVYTIPGNSIVLSNGTVISLFSLSYGVFWAHDEEKPNDKGCGTGSLRIVRSVDGGEHYKDEIKVADLPCARTRHNTIPNIAVDPGSSLFKDRLYIVWQAGWEDLQSKIREEILISHSTDHGQTWSSPTQIGNDSSLSAGAVNQYQPTVAVNEDGGVAVMWYEGFETATTEGYWVDFTASLDGGETWTPAARVSEAPCEFGKSEKTQINGSVVNEGERGPIKLQLWPLRWLSSGHTAGLAADAHDIFHAFWVDNRTGFSQVWTAPITLSGHTVRNGAKELANLDDLSSKVKIEIAHTNFDATGGNVSATVSVKNISEHTITVPLKLRISSLRSNLGIPKLQNTENGLAGDGAILDLSELLPGGVLKPNEVSAQHVLSVKIANLQPPRSEWKWHTTEAVWRLLTLKARLYGRTQP